MSITEEVAVRANGLVEQLARQTGNEEEALEKFANELSDLLPLDSEHKIPLSRVLNVPVSLCDPWIEDTAVLVDAARDYVLDDAVLELLVDRLTVLSWAWGEPPQSWPDDIALAVREDWRDELQRVIE
jgi:hypothetical protein